MDARAILEQLLNSGKQIASQSREFAEKQVGVPESGESRDAMISGLGKGALAGGLLAMLIGTKTGRKVGGKAIKYGSIAAVAAVAYQAYQGWQKQSSSTSSNASGTSISELSGEPANRRSTLLLRAMIAAANADGHIDTQERTQIEKQLKEMGLDADTNRFLTAEIAHPASPEDLAQEVDSPAASTEVYMISSLIVDDANAREKEYLSRLATALKMPPSLVNYLEDQAVS